MTRLVWAALGGLVVACSSGDSTSDAGSDSSTDATTDVAPDVAYPEASPPCQPIAVDAGAVSWTPPHPANPAGCSDVQIAAYFTSCLPGSQATCQTWTSANASCYACLHSTAGKDTSFGAVIDDGAGIAFVNLGGCIALENGDTSATGCGAREWEATECADIACSTSCPNTSGDPTAYAAYESCVGTALGGTCATFESARCDLADAGGAACGVGLTAIQEQLTAVATVMCGGYPADAGPPDAAAD